MEEIRLTTWYVEIRLIGSSDCFHQLQESQIQILRQKTVVFDLTKDQPHASKQNQLHFCCILCCFFVFLCFCSPLLLASKVEVPLHEEKNEEGKKKNVLHIYYIKSSTLHLGTYIYMTQLPTHLPSFCCWPDAPSQGAGCY